MVSNSLPFSDTGEYICLTDLNLYVLADCQELATQGKQGRQLRIISSVPTRGAIEVCLCEDNYSAWVKVEDLQYLQPAEQPYQAKLVERKEILKLIPKVVDFTHQAMNTPNYYLWGGTVEPNYDCSGLMQAAFANVGVWLPRDSYQQEAFTQRITQEDLMVGDLVFFGDERVNHVALYLGNNQYIHSSGEEIGNNGIAINKLEANGDRVSNNYYQKLWSFGRVISSFISENN